MFPCTSEMYVMPDLKLFNTFKVLTFTGKLSQGVMPYGPGETLVKDHLDKTDS